LTDIYLQLAQITPLFVEIPGQASFQGNNYDSAGITIPTLELAPSLYAQIFPVLQEVGPTSVTIYFNGKRPRNWCYSLPR